MGNSWIFPIVFAPKWADRIGSPDETEYYLKISPGLGPLVRGCAAAMDDERLWRGTPEEIENAIEAVRRFIAQPDVLLEEGLQDVELQTAESGTQLEYRVKLNDEWSTWRNAGPLAAGPQGIQGETGETGTDGREIEIAATHPLDSGDLPIPNVLHLFWRYTGEIDWQLVGEITAPQTDAEGNLLTFVEPRGLVAGNLIQFEGRFQVWDTATGTWGPSGSWFEIAPLLEAPQGPIGETGADGPIGETGPVGATGAQGIPGEPGAGYLSGTGPYGYRDVMWIALEMARATAETAYIMWTYPLSEIEMQVYSVVVRLGASVVPSLEGVQELLGSMDPAYDADVWTDEAVIEAAGQLIYDEIVNHPQLTESELAGMADRAGDPDEWKVNVEDAPKMLAALLFEQFTSYAAADRDFRHLYQRLKTLSLTVADKPNWIREATPDIADWSYVGDFAAEYPDSELWSIVQGGWNNEPHHGVVDAFGVVRMSMTGMGETYTITQIEVVWSIYSATDPVAVLLPLDEDYPLSNGEFQVFQLNGLEWVTNAFDFRIETGGPSMAIAVIHRISLAGFGIRPPWATG